MKKKIIISITAIILCISLVFGITAFADDGFSNLSAGTDAPNLAVTQLETIKDSKDKKNTKKAVDSNINTSWKSSKNTDYLILTFNKEVSFNTVILKEAGWNVEEFSLSYLVKEGENERWETFYKQDAIEDYRYCTFETVTTSQLKLEVTKASNVFKIREIEVYNVEKKELNNFRVSDYVTLPNLIDGSVFDEESDNYFAPEYCDVINQIHVIAAAKWNDDGELVISDGASGQELKAIVQKIRDYYGEKDIEIFATVFFNNCDPDTVLTQKKDIVISNTVDFLLEYGFDGVSYDWEYPNSKQWVLFNEHLINLKNELNKHNLKLSCAVFPWSFNMSSEAIDALDQIEIMAYDNFDQNGNHSSFNSGAVQPVQFFLERGFKPEQINLGVPFYARPEDASGVWVDYDDEKYNHTDKFENYSDGMWFSSGQMTIDKTAYAIDNNLGGMMIFMSVEDVEYDSDLSLLKSMKTAIDARSTIKTQNGGAENEK